MIKIIDKNLINQNVSIFVSDDEPLYKYASLFMGMLKKNYITGNDLNDVSTAFNSQDNLKGNRIKFYKSNNAIQNYSFLNIRNSKNLRLKSSNYRNYLNFKYSYNFNNDLNEKPFERYSKNMSMNITNDFDIESAVDVENNILSIEEDKTSNIINKLIFFEENYQNLKTLCHLSCFCSQQNSFKINLKEFSKLNKYIPILNQVKNPTKEAKKHFLELCSILKNNNLIDTLKVNLLTFMKKAGYSSIDSANLRIKFLNFPLIHEKNFGRFNYLDHPGINFLADFLDKANLLNMVEARISKEILTKM